MFKLDVETLLKSDVFILNFNKNSLKFNGIQKFMNFFVFNKMLDFDTFDGVFYVF